jgi:coenzyme F420 hydrogenase subunit beta
MHLTGSPTRILAGSGSVYLPVDLAQAVREAAGEGGSLAVAGLPCHIHAWRKAARRIPTLGRRLKVTIGIFCDHRIDLSYLRLLLGLHRIPFAAVTAVRFRGEGWPGSIRIELEGGGAASIPYADPVRKLLWKAYVGTPRRCLLCPDALADAADIAAGDAWLPEFAGDTLGTNLVVARTPVGRDLLGILAGDGTLALAPAPPDALARSQRVQLLTKGAWLSSRLLLARLTGGAVPVLDLPRPGPRWSGLAAGSLAFAIAAASRRPLLGRALGFLPWRRLAGAIFFGGAGS